MKGSDCMNFNNRGNQRVYASSCSFLGCLFGMFIILSIIQGGLYFFYHYFWLIALISLVIWIFRIWNSKQSKPTDNNNRGARSSGKWSRDFENRKDTSYHNIDRDFEEVDEEEDDDF